MERGARIWSMRGWGPAWLLVALLHGCAEEDPAPVCGPGTVPDADGTCVDAACGATPFPTREGGFDLYVAPWGDDDARGTEEDPLATLEAAWESALERGGASIALGADEGGAEFEGYFLVLDDGEYEVVGRCARLVRIAPTGEEALFWAQQAELRIEGVTAQGPLYYLANSSGRVRDTTVDGAEVRGIFAADDAELELRDVIVSGTEGGTGAAISVDRDGVIDGEGVQVADSEGSAFTAQGGTLRLNGCSTTNTSPPPRPVVFALGSGTIELEDCVISDVMGIGPGLFAQGGSIEVSGVEVLGKDDGAGVGASAQAGGRIRGVDLSVRGVEVALSAVAGDVDVTGFIHDGAEDPDLQPCVQANLGGVLRLEDPDLRCPGRAGLVAGDDSSIDVLGGRIADGRINVYAMGSGSTVSLAEATLERGLVLVEAGASLTMSATEVLDTSPHAVWVAGGTAVVEGGRITGAPTDDPLDTTSGFRVESGGHLTTLSTEVDGGFDVAGIADAGGVWTATGFRSRGTGIGLDGLDGGVITASEVDVEADEFGVVADQLATVEIEGGRVSGTGGTALLSRFGATLHARALTLGPGPGLGVQAVDGGELELMDAELQDVGIGFLAGTSAVLRVVSTTVTPTWRGGFAGEGALLELEDVDFVFPASSPHTDGLTAIAGGRIEARGVTLVGAQGVALFASRAGSTLRFEEGRVEGTTTPADWAATAVIVANPGSRIDLIDAEIVDNRCIGALVANDAELHGVDASFERNQFAGIIVGEEGSLTLSGGTVAATASSPSLGTLGGVALTGGPRLTTATLSGVLLTGNRGLQLAAWGHVGLSLQDSVFEGGGGGADVGLLLVDGAVPWDGTVGVSVEGCAFQDIGGDAVLMHAASARLENNSYSAVGGEPTWWQSCDGSAPVVLGEVTSDVSCREEWREISRRRDVAFNFDNLEDDIEMR